MEGGRQQLQRGSLKPPLKTEGREKSFRVIAFETEEQQEGFLATAFETEGLEEGLLATACETEKQEEGLLAPGFVTEGQEEGLLATAFETEEQEENFLATACETEGREEHRMPAVSHWFPPHQVYDMEDDALTFTNTSSVLRSSSAGGQDSPMSGVWFNPGLPASCICLCIAQAAPPQHACYV